MHLFKKVVGLLLLLAPFSQVSAQQQPTLKLAELLSRVSAQAPSLQADSSAINISKSIAEDTRYNWLPSLKLNYQSDLGTNNNVPGAYFGFGIVPQIREGSDQPMFPALRYPTWA